MTVQIDWLDEQAGVLHVQFIGYWTWAELAQAIRQCQRSLVGSPYLTIDAICSVDGSHPPGNYLVGAREMQGLLTGRFGMAVILGDNLLIETVVNTITSVYRPLAKRLSSARRLDDALYLIERQRLKRKEALDAHARELERV